MDSNETSRGLAPQEGGRLMGSSDFSDGGLVDVPMSKYFKDRTEELLAEL